ncbi:MAG TPA: UDP-N-acetylglucosamine 4,6-dehydratase (inverting) [Candidatus Omnitrophota bacterium]|nr:UDP-N-acetylglucosamine 4,6-dehydratase (inverting) [Candidatus Omnitrophota bacterium]HNQ50912.1 UDP-N-acetylglucosamine 4,6-dehydratase (inverting) [Candidatus Omnitrophota bacterium]
MNWSTKTVLLTGGTGSFGQKFTEIMLDRCKPKVIRIFSRDELKQWEMERAFHGNRRLRYFIGDIRDEKRLERAMDGVDIVVHAAALKHVPLCEYNPFEAIKTNILGAQNVVDAAINHNVDKVMAISTDKSVNPVNLYGSTKMCMEKLFIAANSYVGGDRQTRLACVRYGNVIGSRGSVIPLFAAQKKTGVVTVTDKRMTRFWLTLEQGVEFVIRCIEVMKGGETFVPKIPSMKVIDLAKAIAPDCRVTYSGIRPGEKIHETLLTQDESRHALEFGEFFVVEPEHPWWNVENWKGGKTLPEGFTYSSDANTSWLSGVDLKKMMKII